MGHHCCASTNPDGTLDVHHHHGTGGRAFYHNRLFQLMCLCLSIVAASWLFPSLQPIRQAFFSYVRLIWWAVLLGLIVGGLIEHLLPQDYVSYYLARRKKRSILYAVGLGFLMSACSHGILAISIGLYKKGASIPSVVAFLLASPWANLPVTILLFGFFGRNALLFVLFAIVIAITTGYIFQILDHYQLLDKDPYKQQDISKVSIWKDLRQNLKPHRWTWSYLKADLVGISKGTWALAKMVLWWIVIGAFLAALARVYIPGHIFETYMGPGLFGLGITLLVSTLIEICSEGSAPLAFEIYHHGGAFGNVFVFLMAGVATDYTEIGLLWSSIGRRTAIWLPLITVPQILAVALVFNVFL